MKDKPVSIRQKKENTILDETRINDFAPYETMVIDKNIAKINYDHNLVISNTLGAAAEFTWQKGITEKGYFKELLNDIGVTVDHNSDSITVTNGGARQILTIVFRVQD